MSVYGTRKIRNLAAVLTLLSGCTHIAQLWFRETDGPVLLTALVGAVYLLLGLGLSGQSRFALWASAVAVCASAAGRIGLQTDPAADWLTIWHLMADTVIAALCLTILYRTRYADMD